MNPPTPPTAMTPPAAPRRRNRGTHLFLFCCIAMVAAFLTWASYGQLDVVSLATGDVVPAGQVKAVQHLEGGIVREILVREGDKVKKDQPLVRLEPVRTSTEVEELNIRLRALRIAIIRLEVEAAGGDSVTFPAKLTESQPDLVRQALDLFEIRRQRVDNQIQAQEHLLEQRRQEIKEVQARLKNNVNSLKLLGEQLKISKRLLKLDLSNRMNHLNLLKEESELKGRLEEDRAILPRAKAAQAAARSQLAAAKNGFMEEARKELVEVRRTTKELNERLRKFEDSLRRTVLRAPVDGIVKTLYVVTVGGVVQPGGTVLDIVPGDDRLVIEAKLPTGDIGFVHVGQEVLVQLASAEAVRFGTLDGKVAHVSPDTIVTREGMPYYKVRVETEQSYFEHGNLKYHLSPGMQVQASIRTGTRTVMGYLLDPYIRSFGTAMQER